MSQQSRTGKQQLADLASRLSERDYAIVGFIRSHRFATTTQIRRRFFVDHTTQTAATRACIRVLDRLYGHRLLNRLERRVGGVKHGSASFIWHLDVVGDRLMRGTTQAPRRRFSEPSLAFLEHALDVTEAHVRIFEAADEDTFELTLVAVETEAWRSFLTPAGVTTILKPDLFVTLGTAEYDDHWYIEIDRGMESLPVLLRKCAAYTQFRRTGRAQAEFGVYPRVLWVVPTQRLQRRLTAAIAADPDLPDALFVVATNEQFIATLRDPPPP